MFVFLIPPFQSPDEDSHFKRSYQISKGNFYPIEKNHEMGNYFPEEMLLYIFSTNNVSPKSSRYNFDDGTYQNLLGVRWANPYENVIEIDLINNKKDTGKTEIVPPVTMVNTNESNSSLLIILMLVLGLSMSLKRRFN